MVAGILRYKPAAEGGRTWDALLMPHVALEPMHESAACARLHPARRQLTLDIALQKAPRLWPSAQERVHMAGGEAAGEEVGLLA